ncbi:uncharacterized protein LOC126374988 [Pectinophora gossypiella]|uniref:uncharacterized protein LOC126374988 n=1 Tax=Pectinophora gossypiella TaxID=13191 RepID=UPI00214E9202|nr:uncharacterized protein LOC126374988 [Pectinophora gossypiella]
MSEPSQDMELQATVSEEMLQNLSNCLKSSEVASNIIKEESKETSRVHTPNTAFEVFRNNTTAVEVIVKEVPYRHRKVINRPKMDCKDYKVKRLEEEVESLKIELNKANIKLINTRKGFHSLVNELKKQLDIVSQRELEEQTMKLNLQMENERVKTLLDSKSRLLIRLKKEITGLKHMLKFVVKGIKYTPQLPENFTFTSDPDYDEFEKGLKKDFRKMHSNLFDVTGGGVTFDSTFSKSFEKD